MIYMYIWELMDINLVYDIPSSKLTWRPWQSSGLVQISETTKNLGEKIRGQQVNLPEANTNIL